MLAYTLMHLYALFSLHQTDSQITINKAAATTNSTENKILPVQVTIADVKGSTEFTAAATTVGVVAAEARTCEEGKMGKYEKQF